jgi:hypothetical protein
MMATCPTQALDYTTLFGSSHIVFFTKTISLERAFIAHDYNVRLRSSSSAKMWIEFRSYYTAFSFSESGEVQ